MKARQRRLLVVFLWVFLLALVFHAYLPGAGAGLQFDDRGSLDGLSGVETARDALAFVFSGSAGPTGRPLSLASFLLHTDAWPHNPGRILLTNIILHLTNGLLVGLLTYLLAKSSPAFVLKERAPWASLAVAAIWLLLPLLASSNLLIVQRMTTLAAFFTLLGLILHVLGRSRLPDRTVGALWLMSLGLMIGLGLGVLSKENAAVYPFLVLALDRTLLSGLPRPKAYRRWRMFFIFLPAALVSAYLLQRLDLGATYDARHFSMPDRIATQGVILFDYLRLMLVPSIQMLGPYHDHYPVYGDQVAVLAWLATAFWVAIAGTAVWLGPRVPILAFGVLWFLAGHSVESTWIMLELYFEHRNYLPAIGVIAALVFGLGQIKGGAGALAYAGFAFYAGVLAFLLVQVTALWGRPSIAAEVWLNNNPESFRAAHFAASRREAAGNPLSGAQVLDQLSAIYPTHVSSQIQSLRMTCVAGDDQRARELLANLVPVVREAQYGYYSPYTDSRALRQLLDAITSGRCKAVSYSDIDRMAAEFLHNPIVQRRSKERFNYYIIRAWAAQAMGQDEAMMDFVVTALEQSAQLPTARVAVEMALERGRTDWVQRVIAAIESDQPSHPVQRLEWQNTLGWAKETTEKAVERHPE